MKRNFFKGNDQFSMEKKINLLGVLSTIFNHVDLHGTFCSLHLNSMNKKRFIVSAGDMVTSKQENYMFIGL